MKFTFLGTGTSHGVPVIACNCKVCRSKNKKNKRNRCSSFFVTDDNIQILIDVSPEFRIQALQNNITKVDYVLLTHSHADHLHGVDDLRNFSSETAFPNEPNIAKKFLQPPIKIYSNKTTLEDFKYRFAYLFFAPKEGGGTAKIQLEEVSKPFYIGKTLITPIPMKHGHLDTYGYLITKTHGIQKRSIAYLTDCNYIPEESISLIKENCGTLEHLVIDALRIKKHSTHFNYLEAMQEANRIGIAKNVWFTHMTHQVSHKDTIKYINKNKKNYPALKKTKILPAYDGLNFTI